MGQLADFLSKYVTNQLGVFFPDGSSVGDTITRVIDPALERTHDCIRSILPWRKEGFNYLNSAQYATFLYFLSNSIWANDGDVATATRLFLLNKTLNGIELFYEIDLPKHFFLSHTTSLVFAKATYGDYCVFHQNCTIGRKGEARPVIEKGLVMYPSSMIIGNCHIGENTVLAPGVCLVDQDTPGNCYVLPKKSGNGTQFKTLNRYFVADYFDLSSA